MRDILAKTIFLFHSAIVLFWLSLLFIPTSWWPNKITFHFYFTLFIIFHQLLWGFLIFPWTKRYRLVCFLTTLTQFLRGEEISDEKNYNHCFAKEFFGKAGMNISHQFVTRFTLIILIITAIQYHFFH